MTQPGLVIFDCDGVLVDSEPIAARVFRDAIAELGLSMSIEEVDAKFRGRSLQDCLILLEQDLGRSLPGNFYDELVSATLGAFETELQPIHGVAEVLAELARRGQARCVASSGSPKKIRTALRLTGILQYFDDAASECLFSASQVEHGKPAPDLFLYAAAQMGVPPQDCVVIEDSRAGVEAAVRAEMRVLGYAALGGPPGHAQALAAIGAQPFASMSELPGLLLHAVSAASEA